jgi:hypothetical protein
MNTNEAFENTIEEAFTGNFVKVASHVKTAFPENFNNFTSPPSPPDPMPASVPLAVILPPRTDRKSISEVPGLALCPAPIPAPYFEPLAVIFPANIVRLHTLVLPLE